jgi:hypothetical protein
MAIGKWARRNWSLISIEADSESPIKESDALDPGYLRIFADESQPDGSKRREVHDQFVKVV